MPAILRLVSWLFSRGRTTLEAPRRRFSEWSITGVRFADDGLNAGVASEASMTWTDEHGAIVDLTQAAFEEAIRRCDVERFRSEQRRLAAANGRGLVCADVSTTPHGVPVLQVITKARRGMGHDYVGTVTGTDGWHTYTVRITAPETGVTGLREAAVSAQLWELGEIQLPASSVPGRPQAIEGWFADPYDPTWDDEATNSITDDARLDVAFPSHPLSRVRAFLERVRKSLVFDGAAPESQDAAGGGLEPQAARRLLSDPAVRELHWKHECFGSITASLKDALAAIEGPGTSRDERVAELLLLLGITEARQENHQDALTSLTRALKIYRALCGSDHVKTAVATGHLARAYLALGNLTAAAPLFVQAIEVLEAALPNHIVLGMALSGYGRLLIAQNSPEALPYVVRARDMAEALGGGKRYFLLQETAGAPAPSVSTRTSIV